MVVAQAVPQSGASWDEAQNIAALAHLERLQAQVKLSLFLCNLPANKQPSCPSFG
jgi:hypothetical protein